MPERPVDRLGRPLRNLRISVTDRCNMRCGYCMPEAEYAWLEFQELGASSLSLGRGHRLGVLGRFDVLRLDSHVVGANSMLAVYIEGGAGVAWNGWYAPAYDEASRLVPEDSKNVEGIAGAGIAIDHRLQEPISFPRRIGWFLGWRMGFAPHETEAAATEFPHDFVAGNRWPGDAGRQGFRHLLPGGLNLLRSRQPLYEALHQDTFIEENRFALSTPARSVRPGR